MNLLQRIPDNIPLYVPVPLSVSQFLSPDVLSASNGNDGMGDDFLMAAAGADAETALLAADAAELGLLEADSLLSILDQVNATGIAMNAFQAQGDVLVGAVNAVTPPPDPGASAPPQGVSPAPINNPGLDPGPQPGEGPSGCDPYAELCNGCFEGDEPGCFVL